MRQVIYPLTFRSDIINIDISFVTEVECAFAVLFAERVRLVDLRILWKLAVCLEVTGFIGSVLDDDIGFVVLELSEG